MSRMLDGLVRLQKVELQLHAIERSIRSRQNSLRGIERRIEAHDRDIAAKEAQIRELQVAADEADLEIRTHEERITKLKDDLNKAKTNKEYAAILTNMNTEKADNSKREEAGLQKLTLVDAARKELEAIREDRKRDEGRLAKQRAEVDAFVASRADDLERLRSERNQIAADLPPAAVESFERVADRHDGEAMATVEQPDRRRQEFVCGGCHMSIPLDIYNAVHAGDDIKHCGSCGRILYLETARTQAG